MVLCCLLALPLRAAIREQELQPGSRVQDRLAAGGRVDYRIRLLRGQALDLRLIQAADQALKLTWSDAPADRPLALQTEAGRTSVLGVTATAGPDGWFRFSVEPAAADKGATYSIDAGTLHAIGSRDQERAAAQIALAQAEAFRHAGGKVDVAAASALYQSAIQHGRDGGDPCGLRRIFMAWSGLRHEAGDAAGQQVAARQALQQPCAGDLAEQALSERLLGSAYNNQGDYAGAAAETERAVRLFEKTGDIDNRGIALGNLGLAYGELGETGKALATAQAALQAADASGDRKLQVFVHNSIGFLHVARGELAAAIDAYRGTLNSLQQTPYPMVEAVAWINLGVVYQRIGEGEEAYRAFAKAKAAATPIDCWSCLAEAAVDEGDALFDDGRLAEAASDYRQALDLGKAHGLERQQAEALRGLGNCAMASGDWALARKRLQAARDRLHHTSGPTNESVAWRALGDLEGRLGHLDAARRDYRTALDLARAGTDQTEQITALGGLARLARQAGDLAGARTSIEQALEMIESERSEIEAPELRTSYFASKRAYYALDVDVLMRFDRRSPGHGYAAAALEVAERARARSLRDMLVERGIDLARRVDPALLQQQREAEDELHAAAYRLTQLSASAGAGDRAAAAQVLNDADRRLDEVRGSIRKASPRYAELSKPRSLSVGEMQSSLIEDGATVIEYWLGDESSYGWAVTRTGLSGFVLPPARRLDAQAETLRQALMARPPANVSMDRLLEWRDAQSREIAQDARTLGDVLLTPARAQLRHATQVVIVADGKLQLIPFNLFRMSGAGKTIGESQEVSYLPSIDTLRWLRRDAAGPSAGGFAVFADPVFRLDDTRLQASRHAGAAESEEATPWLRAASDAGFSELPRLPYTRREASEAAKLLPAGRAWMALDFNANRRAALAADWHSYSVVDFATHALLDLRRPELSGIVLSLYDEQGRPRDGYLRMNDIYGLDMPVDLVVLSTCDSAVGKDTGTEGLYSLSRAFFYAGARRVLATLWPVDDRAGAEFMQNFYQALLARHESPADALRDAQARVAAQPRWAAATYWAGYVLQGDWR